MALKVEAKGGKGGNQWDDGSDYHDVTKILVRGGVEGVQFIKFEYVKAGKTTDGPIHGVSGRGFTQTFEVNNLEKEYLLSVEGYYKESTGVIQSLQFITNKKTSDVIGYNEGTNFSLRASRSKIIGFHGFADKNLNSLGAYFIQNPAIKSAIQGGQTSGRGFDDGGDYDAIRKVFVTTDGSAIRHVRFDYEKADQVETRERGEKIGTQHEFTVNHPYEYITSVEGTYAHTKPYNCVVLTSLTFKTSKGRSSPIIGKVTGTKFVLQNEGNAIVGFHGRVGSCVDGIGAYYSPLPPSPPLDRQSSDGALFIRNPAIKSAIEGGQTSGKGFDDGGDYDGIRKVFVTTDGYAIRHVRFDYDIAGQVDTRERGEKIGTQYEFAVDHHYEYITSVEGTYAHTKPYNCVVLTSLTFKTSKGRVSPTIGKVTGTRFKLERQGDAIVGFHGRVGSCIDGIGAYYAALPRSPAAAEKLQGQGGEGGDSWDDGALKNVKKIYVGQGDVGIAFVKFEYENHSSEVIVGDDRGKKTLLGYEEFELDYPSEYITAVEGCYDKVLGAETGVITMLKFKTNKRTSPPFGLESANSFILGKEGHKIVGFHGTASTLIHQIGVHVAAIV